MKIFGIVTLFVFLIAGATFAQDVKVDYDHEFDFKTLKTFAVKLGTSWGNPLSEKRVITEIEEELINKGWTKTEEATAEAIVMLHGATQEKQDLNTFYSGYGGYRWGGWGGGMGTAHTTVSEYTVGTLVVDIFDAKSKQLVFRGAAQDEISDKAEKKHKEDPESQRKNVQGLPSRI